MADVMISAFGSLFEMLRSITLPFFGISAFTFLIGVFVVGFSINLLRYILGVSNDNNSK